jgi:hypothetical protein
MRTCEIAVLLLLGFVCAAGCNRSHKAPTVTSSTVPTIQDALTKAKSVGLILHGTEMQRAIPSSDKNAAPLYVRLARVHSIAKNGKQSFDDEVPWHSANYKVEKRDVPALSSFLKKHGAELNLIREAVERPECVFSRNWNSDDPGNVLFPELAAMRHGVRLLAAKSRLLVVHGRFGDACNALTGGLRMARHAGNDRLVSSLLIRIALEAISLSALRSILLTSNGDPQVASMVRRTIEREWTQASYGETLKSEAWFGYQVLEISRRLGPSGTAEYTADPPKPLKKIKPSFGSDHERKIWSAIIDTNEAILLDRTCRAVAEADSPIFRSGPILRSIFQEARPKASTDPSQYFANVLTLDYEETAQKCAMITASANVTRAASILLIWKAQHGRFPENIEELQKTWPIDPFDFKPLKYRLEGDGFVVFSIGKDAKFDGGTLTVKPSSGDAVFRFPMPPYIRPASEYKSPTNNNRTPEDKK